MDSGAGALGRRRAKDKAHAAQMKRDGICRTTGICGNCYRSITVDSWKSRYNHICR